MTDEKLTPPVVEIDETDVVAITEAALASIPEPAEFDLTVDMYALVGITPPDES